MEAVGRYPELMLAARERTPESYWTGTITANLVDEEDLKIAWMYTSEREGDVSVLDIHYMVGSPAGIEQFTEVHHIGLFTQREYLDALADAGFRADFDPDGLFRRGLYIAQSERR